MSKIVRLTESDLTRIVKRVIIESNKQPTKAEILDMSEDELENLGNIKGEYLGKKGEFFNFKKKGIMGVICGFRTDDKTPDGLRKSYRSLKVKDNEVKFNQKKTSVNESDKEKDDKSSNETKIPLQLRLKFQKFLRSAKGEEGEDTYLDRRRDAFIKELDGYREMEVRTKLFQKLESEYGKVPGKFRAPFRWYK